VPRGSVVAVEAAEEHLRDLVTDLRDVLANHGQAGVEQPSEGEVVEPHEGDLARQPPDAQGLNYPDRQGVSRCEEGGGRPRSCEEAEHGGFRLVGGAQSRHCQVVRQ
jgi:hypothetical protein